MQHTCFHSAFAIHQMTTNHLPFTQNEYDTRVQHVRQAMHARGIDLLLVDQTEFLAYLTGFAISENMYRACLLPLEGEPIAILRAVDRTPFEESSWLTHEQTVGFADWEDPVEVLAATVKTHGWDAKRIGIDEESYCMPLRRFKKLQGRLPEASFVDFSGVLERLRARKSAEEIAYLRRASEVADAAFADIIEVAHEGSTSRDAAATAHTSYIKHGADSIRPGIFTVGEGDSFLHGGLSDRPLRRGEVLHVELVPTVKGYGARLMRPALVGAPDPQRVAIARRLLEIQDRQFEAMGPNKHAAEIDAIARSSVLEAGLRADYVNITGYTLGYYPASTPRTSDFTRVFHPRVDWVLESGMVFHMYVSAAGIAFSETVLVTDTGIELLTRSPRKMFQI